MTLSRRIGLRLATIGVGVLGGMLWLAVDGDELPVQETTFEAMPADAGRTLTEAERVASRDCVPVARWKATHDGYPSPYMLVKPVDGGPAKRLGFDRAYALATAGEVWTHAACPDAR